MDFAAALCQNPKFKLDELQNTYFTIFQTAIFETKQPSIVDERSGRL